MTPFAALPPGPVRLDNLTVPGCLAGDTAPLVPLSLTLAGGRIVEGNADATVMDLARAMVFPAFVDMHTHLDKGNISPRSPNPDGTFPGALEVVRADKIVPGGGPGRWDAADLRPRMEFSLACAYAHGTSAIRTHLDQFDPDRDATWPVFSQLREECAGRIALQGACPTGLDMARDPALLAAIADLVARHRGGLGAVTYPETDLPDLLRTFFAAAADRGLDVDFHVDETLDPEVNTLADIAVCVLDHGFDLPVTVGHVCSLTTMPEDDVLRTLDLVARAGLHVVSLPMCNLYLQDRHAGRTPRHRGITLVHEMKARGIPVSFAFDGTRDPFYAYGDMDMLEVMREATRIGHLDHSDPDWTRAFLTAPAACGFDIPNLGPGAPADLVICRARSWTELFARPQSDRLVIRGGVQIDTTLPDYALLDPLMEAAP